VTHSSLNRLNIYAALAVPEIWRLEGSMVTFYVLNAQGAYETAANSRAFPLVRPQDLLGFMQQARHSGDSNAVIRQFRAWIRQQSAAGAGPQPSP
jgi:hypothetical protein